jgi:hypothetical protein
VGLTINELVHVAEFGEEDFGFQELDMMVMPICQVVEVVCAGSIISPWS